MKASFLAISISTIFATQAFATTSVDRALADAETQHLISNQMASLDASVQATLDKHFSNAKAGELATIDDITYEKKSNGTWTAVGAASATLVAGLLSSSSSSGNNNQTPNPSLPMEATPDNSLPWLDSDRPEMDAPTFDLPQLGEHQFVKIDDGSWLILAEHNSEFIARVDYVDATNEQGSHIQLTFKDGSTKTFDKGDLNGKPVFDKPIASNPDLDLPNQDVPGKDRPIVDKPADNSPEFGGDRPEMDAPTFDLPQLGEHQFVKIDDGSWLILAEHNGEFIARVDYVDATNEQGSHIQLTFKDGSTKTFDKGDLNGKPVFDKPIASNPDLDLPNQDVPGKDRPIVDKPADNSPEFGGDRPEMEERDLTIKIVNGEFHIIDENTSEWVGTIKRSDGELVFVGNGDFERTLLRVEGDVAADQFTLVKGSGEWVATISKVEDGLRVQTKNNDHVFDGSNIDRSKLQSIDPAKLQKAKSAIQQRIRG
jgi:uncharacterized protein YkuJ